MKGSDKCFFFFFLVAVVTVDVLTEKKKNLSKLHANRTFCKSKIIVPF